jgi:ribonucleoside-diphosphate reductase beta chain
MSNLTEKNNSRFVLFPIKYNQIWKAYKEDNTDWEKLNTNEKHFISNVLAFFAASDGIVGENLAMRFYNDVGIPEARIFYGYQLMIEGIHSEMYSLLIDTYIKNQEEKNRLLNAIETIPVVKEKAEWAMKWIDSNESFEERLVAFAAVEGIFFSSSFCSIYWLKKRNLMPGLAFSNEAISTDEGQHCEFACLLHSLSDSKVSKDKIHQIIKEAVSIEEKFCTDSLPVELIGMNSKEMVKYVRFCADRLSEMLDAGKIYNEKNPFDFMEMISLKSKSNFFEKRVIEYQKASVGKKAEDNQIKFDEDF